MKRELLTLFVGSAMVLGAATAVAGEKDEALLAEVTAIGDAMTKAMLADDLEGSLAFYLDDAISLPNFSPMLKGKEAMRAHHDEMVKMGVKILAFDSHPLKVWTSDDLVIEIGKYSISLEMAGAPAPIADRGKYLTIYERQKDGSLKVKVETWNTDVDPMTMMGGHEPNAHHEKHDHHHDQHHGG